MFPVSYRDLQRMLIGLEFWQGVSSDEYCWFVYVNAVPLVEIVRLPDGR
jgi:hypothetical protein